MLRHCNDETKELVTTTDALEEEDEIKGLEMTSDALVEEAEETTHLSERLRRQSSWYVYETRELTTTTAASAE